MIASLAGRLAAKGAGNIIVDVSGVGYRVACSARTMEDLPEVGASVSLKIQTVVREDAFLLFGFLTTQEEELFLLLNSVSNVGPKLALTILSGLPVPELVGAIAQGEVGRLTRVHGIGKRTAERLIVELKDKAKLLMLEEPMPSRTRHDVTSALGNLGYRPSQAEAAAQAAVDAIGFDATFEELLRYAVQSLRGSK